MGLIETSINADTGNPNSRTTPEHRIKRVYAHNGAVVIVANVGGSDVERIVERREAIERAQSLSEMASHAKTKDQYEEAMELVEMFINAIKKAKEQAGKPYTAVSVGMYTNTQAQKKAVKKAR